MASPFLFYSFLHNIFCALLWFILYTWLHCVCWITLLVLRVCTCPWPNTSMMSIVSAELEWPWIFSPLGSSWHIHCNTIVYLLYLRYWGDQFLRGLSSCYHRLCLSQETRWCPTSSICWCSRQILCAWTRAVGLVSGISGTVDGIHRLIIAARRSDAITHKTNNYRQLLLVDIITANNSWLII